jgi:hypothetical protein
VIPLNLGTAKTRAIMLINEYSNNGNLVTTTADADYLIRMNAFADTCQNEISEKVGIHATYTIDSEVTPDVTENGYHKYALPTNFKQHRRAKIDDETFTDYRLEDGYFLIPKGYESQTIVFVYFRYPTEITSSTADSYEFEVDAFTHRLIPYYLAGMVVADEKPEISDKMLNIYYEGLGKLFKRENRYPIQRIANVWW